MKQNVLVALFAVSIIVTIRGQEPNKLHIDVYYETRCPDSMRFMQYQLRRAYPKIRDNVVIKYYPFGKSNSYSQNGETLFRCQHGARECEGNKFQSCVLQVIGSNQDIQTDFVICAMDFAKNPSNCAQNLGLDLSAINSCFNGPEGTSLQLKAEEDSKNIIRRSQFVPTIVYQKNYKTGDFWASLDDFESIVGERLNQL